MDVNLSKTWEMVEDREAWCVAVHEVTKSQTRLSNSTTATTKIPRDLLLEVSRKWMLNVCLVSYPLQYSSLENSMERGAWWAAVSGVAQS